MRASKIPARLILSLTKYDGITAGQYRFNHTDCSAGEDTKERLYIKIPTKQPWTRIAYCHNCGMSGFAALKSNSYDYRRAKNVENILREGSPAPGDSHHYNQRVRTGNNYEKRLITKHHSSEPVPFEDCSPEVKARFNHARIDEDRYNRYLLNYNPHIDRIVIPYWEYSETPQLLSTQYKAPTPGTVPKFFTQEEPQAEYKTDVVSRQSIALAVKHGRQKDEYLGFTHSPDVSCLTEGHKTLVIVEDYFSAINIAETSDKYHAFPLAGVHYNTMQLAEICERNLYTHIVVWLDNDNEIVIKKARRLETDLEFLGGGAPVHRWTGANEDPKKLTASEIEARIETLMETATNVL